MKLFRSLLVLTAVLALSAGCASKKQPILPVHDEVLVYKLPYDLTYLRTLDALQTVKDWDLELTDKENGIIRVRNISYSGFNDSEKRVAEFKITRIAGGQSSVEIVKEYQQVLGGGELMKAISRELSQEAVS